MKKVFCILLCFFFTGINTAISGGFFDVVLENQTLIIHSTIPNHSFGTAGIKINTSNFSLIEGNNECIHSPNGYCLFSISDKNPKYLTIKGQGNLNLTLCLNGAGPNSCQIYNVR